MVKRALEVFVAVALAVTGVILWRQWRFNREAAALKASQVSPGDIPAAEDVDPHRPFPPPSRERPHPHSVTGLPMIRLSTPPKKQRPTSAVPSPTAP